MLHVSDLHFGSPHNPPVIAGLESHIESTRYHVVAVSGDLAQRSLSGELQRGARFLADAARVARVIVVPGNHDVAWWMSPLNVAGPGPMFTRYRRWISQDLEPVLDVEGATFVGLNTCHGLALHTLTTRLRDLSIIGAVTPAQLERVAARLAAVSPGKARVVVMHHNPRRGRLSRRFGIVKPARTMEGLAAAGADLILCGHDHEEAVEEVAAAGRTVVVCTGGTLSTRMRGGRPCTLHALVISPSEVEVTTLAWSAAGATFLPSASRCFARSVSS